MSEIDIRIENHFKFRDKGFLVGSFTLIFEPHGMKILDCKHFLKDEREWFSFPTKQIKKGDVLEYIPIISFKDKIYADALKVLVINKLNEGTDDKTTPSKKIYLQSDASDVWFP